MAQPAVDDLDPLAHRTLSDAHRTVRCPHQTVGPAVGVLGPTAHPGLPLKVFFRSRTVLSTVARWFVQGARETVNNDVQVRAA
jgi:hypothetical protein